MYGCMTPQTRQTRANSESSSVVQRRCPRQARRASTAMSTPILFRNLKQSTTILVSRVAQGVLTGLTGLRSRGSATPHKLDNRTEFQKDFEDSLLSD